MALHFTEQEFLNRKNKVLNSMKEQNLNALLMFKQESMYWLTGYDSFGFVFFQSLILNEDGEIILLKVFSHYLNFFDLYHMNTNDHQQNLHSWKKLEYSSHLSNFS